MQAAGSLKLLTAGLILIADSPLSYTLFPLPLATALFLKLGIAPFQN